MQTGGRIKLDTQGRRIDLLVEEAELNKRRAALLPLSGERRRGYDKLYFDTVTQAEKGCDFDFAIPEITKRVP